MRSTRSIRQLQKKQVHNTDDIGGKNEVCVLTFFPFSMMGNGFGPESSVIVACTFKIPGPVVPSVAMQLPMDKGQ